MQCPRCARDEMRPFGKDRKGRPRFRCYNCGKTAQPRDTPLGDMTLAFDKAELALRLLLEGNSIRSTERITGVAANTLCKLVVRAGTLCENFQKKLMVGLAVGEVQCDELWGFVAMKEKTRLRLMRWPDQCGDAYCFIGVERATKLILAWHVGKRHEHDSIAFAMKLRRATSGRFSLSTDGFAGYRAAIPQTFKRGGVDWGVVVKHFGSPPDKDAQRRYSPATIVGVSRSVGMGSPKRERITTSHVERVNLTLRMGIRRLTRLTNGFSKKWENHEAAHALFFAAYNFCRVHSTLKTTPAVAHGLTDHVWSVRELLERAAAIAE